MNRKLIILLFAVFFLSGCAGLRVSRYGLDGKEIKTVYGKGDGRGEIIAITSWAFLRMMPKLPNNVMGVFDKQCNKIKE